MPDIQKRRIAHSRSSIPQPATNIHVPRRRSGVVRAACERCRARKLRCGAERPQCLRCSSLHVECEYATVSESETRNQALRRENESLRRENESLRRENAALRRCIAGIVSEPDSWTTASNHHDPLNSLLSPEGPHQASQVASDSIQSDPTLYHIAANWKSILEPETGRNEESFVPTHITPVCLDPETALQSHSHSEMISKYNDSTASHVSQDSGQLNSQHAGPRSDLPAPYARYPTQQRRAPLPPAWQPSLDDTRTSPRLLEAGDHHAPWLEPYFEREDFQEYGFLLKDASSEPDATIRANSIYSPHRHFGALSFSSAILANHCPPQVQEAQTSSIFTHLWQTLPLRGFDAPNDPMANIFADLQTEISKGFSIDSICGSHAYVAALTEESVYDAAPTLSKLMARLVKSVKPTDSNTSITMFAMFWTHWALFRWMLAPSPLTYAEIPEFMRPTTWQLFAIHPMVVDFVHSPVLRESMCQDTLIDMPWVAQACATIACEWSRPNMDAFCRDGVTGALDLNPIFKAHAAQAVNWSLGPSVRPRLLNADKFWRIRDRDADRPLDGEGFVLAPEERIFPHLAP